VLLTGRANPSKPYSEGERENEGRRVLVRPDRKREILWVAACIYSGGFLGSEKKKKGDFIWREDYYQ